MTLERPEPTERPIVERDERVLHAYHDGELRGLVRWRFERRLARSPELRHELQSLVRLRVLALEVEPDAETPDLWEEIARRLPALDAHRVEGGLRSREPAWAWLWRPMGAAAAAAATAALVFALWSSDNAHAGVVRWLDSGGRSVIVLEDDADVTIIWVLGDSLDGPERGGGA